MLDVPGITRRHVLWPRMEQDIRRALAFVEEAIGSGGVVLVNCQMGCNRSGVVVLAWLLTHREPETGEPLGFTPASATDALLAIQPLALNNAAMKNCVIEMVEGHPPPQPAQPVE